MAINLKPPAPVPDQNRKELAKAIDSHAGAARDLIVAKQAVEQASERCWEANRKLEALRDEPAAPIGSRALEFTASISAGNPCGTDVLERSAVSARAKIEEAERDARVWDETREECKLAVREKEAVVENAREQVTRAARMVVCNAEMVTRLADELEALQSEVINRRSVLRFLWGANRNGQLERPLAERVEHLMWWDLTGADPTPERAAWESAFKKLQEEAEVELPIC